MSQGNFGVWSVAGNAWLTFWGATIRYDTIEEAEDVAADQRRAFPESEWAVHYIGDDGKPYTHDGPVVIGP